MDNTFLLNPFSLDAPAPLLDQLAQPAWIVNRPAIDGADQAARIGAIHRPLAQRVRDAALVGRRAVTVGADCLQPAAVLAGLRQAGIDPVIVWLDAHGDFNTPDTTPSGYIAGMSLAMLVGRGEAWLRENVNLPVIEEHDVVLSDARDLDPGEATALVDSKVAHIRQVADIPKHVPPSRPLYVHFDTDIIDAGEAPATMFPVAGGPSVADLRQMAQALHRTHTVVAVSMTAWDPGRDATGQTARSCLAVFDALVGA